MKPEHAARPDQLRTEYCTDPLGVEDARPRFSWLPAHPRGGGVGGQRAYQVRVASTRTDCLSGGADIWDSGKVVSSQTDQIAFAGTELGSAHRYYWSVRTWDPAGDVSAWAAPATFEMGLLTPGEWRCAQWITRNLPADELSADALPAPLLRKTFRLPDRPIDRARLYISALGYGVAHLDGHRIGTNLLDPAPTNYAETVLYTVHDATETLHRGAGGSHVLAVELGRGRYGEPASNVWFWHKAPWWDNPKLLALLRVWFADGTVANIVSDPSWRAADGPTRFDSLFLGEQYDARLRRTGWELSDYDDTAWQPAVASATPGGALRSQQQEPIRAVAETEPVGVSEPQDGVQVVDFGRQLAGHARLTVSGRRGVCLSIRYGERLDADGLVDISQNHIDGDIQTDTYVLAGEDEEVFAPQFSYKGFQYMQIEGHPGKLRPEDVRAVELHTDVASTGDFACDDELVNRIHQGCRRAILSNLHGLPTDTPTYEKNGWTADAHLTANVASYNFFMPRVYTKWLQDFTDAQLPSGELPPIVPTSGWGYRGSDASITAPVPAWDAAYFEIPWTMYRHYGDERILARHYDGQRRYLDFLSTAIDGGVVYGGLGDFLAPGANGRPPEGPAVHETAYTYRIVTLLKQIAAVLGHDQDLPAYDEIGRLVRDGFTATFFDQASAACHGEVATEYRQSPNVLGLAFDLVPHDQRSAVLDGLVADIRARGNHLDTGVLGTKYLFPLLSDNGLVDLAYVVATQRTYPGYGYWIDQGATALFEAWHADARSRNHHFYGTVDQWFYEDIAGIRPGAAGYAQVRIRPVPPAALGWAKASLTTVRGPITAQWRRMTDGIEITADIPPGVTAEIHVPMHGGYDVHYRHDGTWTFRGE
jgi:alpha-L-rhamnosidase